MNRTLSKERAEELLTQQSSEARQVLCLESQLPGSFRQQILVCGQVLAVPAQFERM